VKYLMGYIWNNVSQVVYKKTICFDKCKCYYFLTSPSYQQKSKCSYESNHCPIYVYDRCWYPLLDRHMIIPIYSTNMVVNTYRNRIYYRTDQNIHFIWKTQITKYGMWKKQWEWSIARIRSNQNREYNTNHTIKTVYIKAFEWKYTYF
jgi:hypothetical protein